MSDNTPRDVDRPVGISLLLGMAASIILLLIGWLLHLLNPGVRIDTVLPVGKAFSESLRWNPAGWLSLGIFVLILTPVARVVIAIVSFAWVRDWKYTAVSAFVLVAMVAGLLLGRG